MSPIAEYGCASDGCRLYTTPKVSRTTPEPLMVTGLYTEDPAACGIAVCAVLSSMINCVIFLLSKVIVSSPINTDPVLPQPIVENTSILSPEIAVPDRVFSSLVLVDTSNEPLTVSGANTIL